MSTSNNIEFNALELFKDTKIKLVEVIHQTEDYSLMVQLLILENGKKLEEMKIKMIT